MTRTNIPISKESRIFHTLHYNFREDKIPLQYALELSTLDVDEAEELKQQIIEGIELKKRVEKSIQELGSDIETVDYLSYSGKQFAKQYRFNLEQLLKKTEVTDGCTHESQK